MYTDACTVETDTKTNTTDTKTNTTDTKTNTTNTTGGGGGTKPIDNGTTEKVTPVEDAGISSSTTGIIVGCVIGGVVLLVGLFVGYKLWKRR